MRLQSEREVRVTRDKLRMLEEQYEATRANTTIPDHARDLTLHSLKKLINQMKEEIAWFQCHATAHD